MYKQCPKCGTAAPDNANFCQSCGYDFNNPPQYREQQYGAYRQPGSYYSNNPFDAAGPEGKSRGVAALLAIFLGWLGIHYFYCGKITGGVLTILLCIVTCSLWSILTFVQGIYFLCITNDEFERKFITNPSNFPIF